MRIRSNVSVILANLTPAEYARFGKARVGYSGSTGADADPASYGGYGPYIATYSSELRMAIKALRWRHFEVTTSRTQWIVRKVLKHG